MKEKSKKIKKKVTCDIMEHDKINKREFLQYVADTNDISKTDLIKAYDALIKGVFDVVRMNKRLSLAGFGSFYLQKHKGHPVQFESNSNSGIKDYFVFKFSASDSANRVIRNFMEHESVSDK